MLPDSPQESPMSRTGLFRFTGVFETLQAVSPVSSSGLPTFQAWLGTARDCRLPTAIEKMQASSGSTSNTLPTRPNLSADAPHLILCLSLFENQHKPPENLSWSLDMWLAGHFTCKLTDWLLLELQPDGMDKHL